MAWLGRLFLLSYPGEDNDAHGGKEPSSAQAVEWLPTLVSQPMFDALAGTVSPASTHASMHSGNRLPNGMLLPLFNMVY